MLVRARPHYKVFAANTSIPFPHRTENKTEMTETYVKVKYMFNVQNYNEVYEPDDVIVIIMKCIVSMFY